jgi:ribosome-associated protein
LRFQGSEIIYVYTKAFNRGVAEVVLDGASQGMLDLYSPAVEWKTATPFRASGPGGQNVNKVSTAVRLRFDTLACASLPEDVRVRLRSLAGRRVGRDGVLRIEARRFRTQEANRQDAVERLMRLLHQAVVKPRARRTTKPSAASGMRRLEAKHRRGQTKQARRPIERIDDERPF